MQSYLSQSFDLGIRIVQLTKWLKDEGKEFPLAVRLLECGTGIGANLRAAKTLNDKSCCIQAVRQVEEVQLLLELMVKTDFITELQSKALLGDCVSIKKGIRDSWLSQRGPGPENEAVRKSGEGKRTGISVSKSETEL